jgi:PAS domain S-box-containing protein
VLYETDGIPQQDTITEHMLPPWSRLLLAYDKSGRIELAGDGLRFATKEILPSGMLTPAHPRIQLVEPVVMNEQHIGYVIFEVIGPLNSEMFTSLTDLISSALTTALLVNQVQKNAKEITRQKNILDTFIETVPDRIWFKDLEGRFTRMNKAHMNILRLPSGEGIGKTEAEIRGVAVGQNVSKDEQTIIQTGNPILNKQVSGIAHDGSQTWTLVTKMPLYDENNKIIGTFGISRDISALKHAQLALEQANAKISKLNEELTDDNSRMHTEMDVAHRIQTVLLPKSIKHIHPDFEIAACMFPAAEVGGDYYDVALTFQNELWINIGDVSGHGVTAGLIMMMAQTILTTIIKNYLVDARDIVKITNTVIYENVSKRMQDDHFMTFTTLKYLGNGAFQYAGAHLPLIAYRSQSKKTELLNTPGCWLNVMPNIEKQTTNSELKLAMGDMLVLYTDGLTESLISKTNKYLGIEGLQSMVENHAAEDVDTLCNSILQEILSASDKDQKDDMTLIVLRRIR